MDLILKKILLCISYLCAGPGLIILNKHVMQELGFKYPITLSALGMVAASIVSVASIKLGWVEAKKEATEIDTKTWVRCCIPVGVCKAATLTFGNATYLYLNLGFIQMLKSFSPVIVMATTVCFGLDIPRSGVIISVCVICIGTAITSGIDPSMNWTGLGLHFGAATTEAVNLVLTQFLLQNKKFSVIEAQYVLAPPGVLFLGLSAWYMEWDAMYAKQDYALIAAYPITFLTASLLGLSINFLTFYVIQYTSSLTLKILGMFRNIFLIFVGMVTYHEVIPRSEALGFTITVLGFIGYNYFKANPHANHLIDLRLGLVRKLETPPSPSGNV
eukprot:TRINITY_DN23461_c0_g1_i1.p1 TRINITY_DN23461_c0_g1~~TRINITY_DN23461_c0_g1_i1.p1  ORF type:complete len:330 (+),score=70.35 TRINITY_DN23461_c0_g1_i1:23-1012(+)